MPLRTAPRLLSFDERLAAEAAFSGRPFNPRWSQAARVVYDGIVQAKGGVSPDESLMDVEGAEEIATDAPDPLSLPEPDVPHLLITKPDEEPTGALLPPPEAAPDLSVEEDVSFSRDQAIQNGGLIEMTPLAKQLGVPYAVGMTRPAWEAVVTASQQVPESAHEGRVRDILLALRLRLMSGPVNRSVIDFPTLLSFPPDSVPQPQLLLAAFHDSPRAPTCITLLLPRELSLLLNERRDP